MTRKIGVTARRGGGLLVVVHVRAPMQRREGATRKLLRELAGLERTAVPALAAQARALRLYLQGYTSAEACAKADVPLKELAQLAYQVRKKGVDTLIRTYGPRLRRGMSAERRAEIGVLADEDSPEGRVARAVCLYVDGTESDAALAEAGIPYLHLQFLADRVRDRGIAYLRQRFRNGGGWKKRYDWERSESHATERVGLDCLPGTDASTANGFQHGTMTSESPHDTAKQQKTQENKER